MKMIRTYSALLLLPTFEERFEYLKLNGTVGKPTFGYERWLNQAFYKSKEYLRYRRSIILRDKGCDLGIEGREIYEYATLHHINPVTIEDIESGDESILNPENAILVSDITHKAIHFGDSRLLRSLPLEREKGDTCLWKASLQRSNNY